MIASMLFGTEWWRQEVSFRVGGRAPDAGRNVFIAAMVACKLSFLVVAQAGIGEWKGYCMYFVHMYGRVLATYD